MKFTKDSEYASIAAYVFLVLLFGLFLVFLFLRGDAFFGFFSGIINALKPVWYGLIYAFLLYPLSRFFETKLFYKFSKEFKKTSLKNILSIVLTYFIFLIVLVLVVLLIVPQLVNNFSELESKIGDYIRTAKKWLDDGVGIPFLPFVDASSIKIYLKSMIEDSILVFETYIPSFVSFFTGLFTETINIILGFLISVYFLLSRESLLKIVKRFVSVLFSEKLYYAISSASAYATHVFGDFIGGKILCALFVGAASFLVLFFLGIAYAPLIALFIGIFDLIPFVGIFIGAIPGFLIIAVVYPEKLILYLLTVILLELIDVHYLEPKLTKDRMKIDLSLVIASVLLASELFGIGAAFIAVPFCIVLYSFLKKSAELALKKKGLPTETRDWIKPAPPVVVKIKQRKGNKHVG